MKNLRSSQPKKQDQHQDAWALQLEMHLKEHDRKFYRSLKEKGELKEYCQRQANEAHDSSLKLREQGVSPFEAQQIVKAQFIFPTGADMP